MSDEPRIIQLPKILDDRGNLSFIEGARHVPFEIARAYWVYDVPGGDARDGHAYRRNRELIVALSGSFDVVLGDGRTFSLNRSYYGLYVPAGTWRQHTNFSTNSLLIDLPRHHSARKGNLTVAEPLPFDIRRVYYIYDVPGGESRGEHAHRALDEVIVAASGSFSVTIDDGTRRREVFLNRPYVGLLVPPGIWDHLHDFSSGAVVMVLSSGYFDESNYIRDYKDFLEYRKNNE